MGAEADSFVARRLTGSYAVLLLGRDVIQPFWRIALKKFFVSMLLAVAFITTAAPASAQTVLRNFVFTLDFEGGSPIQGSIFDEMGVPVPQSGTLIVRGEADTEETTFNRYDVTVNGIPIDNNLSALIFRDDTITIRIREEDSSRVFGSFTFGLPDGLFLGYSDPNGAFNQRAILGLGTFQLAPNATFQVLPVPEPMTWMLLIFGFGAVGAAMRYRNRSSAAVRWSFN